MQCMAVSTSFATKIGTDMPFSVVPFPQKNESLVSPTNHHLAMSSNDESTAFVLDQNVEHSALNYDNALLLQVAETQLLHEATLQDLLRTRNYAIEHLLHEQNELLWEW